MSYSACGIKFFKYVGVCFCIWLSLLVSFGCLANEGNLKSVQPNSKPACAQYCEKIEKILFVFVDEVKILDQPKRNIFLVDLKSLLESRKSKIKLSELDVDRVEHFHQATTTVIKAEIHIYRDSYIKSNIKININVIAPNRFYTNEFVCNEVDLNCLDGIIKKEVNRNIANYLFLPTGGTIQ